METYRELANVFKEDFSSLKQDTQRILQLFEVIFDIHSGKIKIVKEVVGFWEAQSYDQKKAQGLFEELLRINRPLLEKLKELESLDIQSSDFIKELLEIYSRITKSPFQERYQQIFENIKKQFGFLLGDMQSLKVIVENQTDYLQKNKIWGIVSSIKEHSILYHLLDDEAEICTRSQHILINIMAEFKALPEKREARAKRYTIREILPPVPNVVLQRIYEEAYVPLFPDEDERSDIDKLTRSLSERYKGRMYHFLVLMCGPDPVGAAMFDYLTCDYKVKDQRVGFGCMWYIYALKEHARGLSLLKKSIGEVLIRDSLVRNDWLAGVFGEVNDPRQMSEEQIKADVQYSAHPRVRQRVFGMLGFRVCDFDYAQPAEEEDQEPVEYTALVFLPLKDEIKERVSNEMMLSMIYKFMLVEYYMERIPKNQRLFERFKKEILTKSYVTLEKPSSIFQGKIRSGQKQNEISIEPLSRITLHDATKLVNKVFHKQGMEPAWIGFRASLGIQPYSFIVKMSGFDFLRYWVAVDKGRVLGVTGIYTYRKDKEAVWGGWTCVEPDIMGSLSRVGFLLIKRAFQEAKELKRKYIRVYTSTSPTEEAVNSIYERIGFKVFRTKPFKGTPYTIKYMELDLTKPNPELSKIESLG